MAKRNSTTYEWSPWSKQGQTEIKKRRRRWAVGASIVAAGFVLGAAGVYFRGLQLPFAAASEVDPKPSGVVIPVPPNHTLG